MQRKTSFDSFVKPLVMTAFAALALSACQDKGDSAPASGGQGAYEVVGDHAIGNPDAKVTVIEYASVTCGHCANWHTAVYPDFKKKYVDSGKVRFVFREFPTPPESLARAGFLIANCAPEERFFENISMQFKRQRQILTSQDVRQEYLNLAKASGLSEAEFDACMTDEAENERYEAVFKAGLDAGVAATPSFFFNGKKIDRTEDGDQVFTLESFESIIDPLLGADAPIAETEMTGEPASKTETETSE